MCGRFAVIVSPRVLAEMFELSDVPKIEPRYNIAPTQGVCIVRLAHDRGREAATARWGLIPSWSNDAKRGARMINARAETVDTSPAFRAAVRQRRCLIPASGFYEWHAVGKQKQPYLIRFADQRPFAFAGFWERWHDASGAPLDSCTIITTTPNPVVARVHNRMPVILPTELYGEWLSTHALDRKRLDALLAPHPENEMECVRVSTAVNSPANDDPSCVAPLDKQT